eukprot:CAMPEP_0167767084 /NCGR_PEP_ID=MMETSP0110_2-20121227/15804_1 /TAXON_ID=629695 /ORGANISM="Gymnochlora sp., Strain CCMP2014" /LENGTH=231 /DNA_ID=CAMNT_0007655385 /DNA_START=367 /DNA_END=1059 /DNA_ORIENTATION=-
MTKGTSVQQSDAKKQKDNQSAREYQNKYGLKKNTRKKGKDIKENVTIGLRSDGLPDRKSMALLVEQRLNNRGKNKIQRGKKSSLGIKKGRIREFKIPPEAPEGLIKKGTSKKHYTASELEEMAKKRYEDPSNYGNVNDMDYIGQLMLKHTNEFRRENNLPPVYWSKEITDICRVHSKFMGDGKVKFGHDGFKYRTSQFKKVGLYHRSAAENVAMNQGLSYADTARVAVNGW